MSRLRPAIRLELDEIDAIAGWDGAGEEIEGGLEAFFIRDELEGRDRNAYAMSHVGWGFHPGARWDSMQANPNQ